MKLPLLEPDKLTTYLEILVDKKSTTRDFISLGQSPNQKDWKMAQVDLIARTLVEEVLSFIVEQRKDGQKYFLKIRASRISESPCFRFDSDGPSHTNRFDDIPLPERSIPTPHFQRFDQQGRWIAYRTTEIAKPENEASFRLRMNLGLKHFCEEAVIESLSGGLPQVSADQPSLIEIDPNDDPHNGVKFS